MVKYRKDTEYNEQISCYNLGGNFHRDVSFDIFHCRMKWKGIAGGFKGQQFKIF